MKRGPVSQEEKAQVSRPALQGDLGVGFRLGWRDELEWNEGLSSISTDGEMGADADVSS